MRRSGHHVRLGLAAALNTGFGVVQVLVGLAIGSVVVLADAAHQAVDALGLISAFIAVGVARRAATPVWSFGFGKADALGGLVSGLLLVGSVVWIATESIRRLADPEEVSGNSIIAIGVVAIIVNGVGVLLVGHGHDDDAVSLRAARLHLLTDLAGSVVVVVAGVLLTVGGPAWIDPISSLVLSVVVLLTTIRLLRRAGAVLLDRAPAETSGDDIAALLGSQPGVVDAHHVHIRPLGGGDVSVTAHLVVAGERTVHETQAVIREAEATLRTVSVAHSTLQVECHPCDAPNHPEKWHESFAG